MNAVYVTARNTMVLCQDKGPLDVHCVNNTFKGKTLEPWEKLGSFEFVDPDMMLGMTLDTILGMLPISALTLAHQLAWFAFDLVCKPRELC